MSEASDEHFLRAWAERHDETAFRSLMGRYAGFIYGAAFRRVSDAGLAEEITQDVFARLSQNAARLVGHPAISGWLHRAAMLLALDCLRRRRRAEHRIAQLSQMNTPSDADPLAEALPHLDEALDQLASRDREVLVLHFFDRLTFPEIATRLGGSADAARMRTNRALSALSASLRKKGVTLSVTALATGLGGTFAQAAPASLAIIPAALAGAGKVSALSVIIHALQTMKTAKAATLAALALVLATPLIFQQQQIAAAEARIAAIQKNRAPDLVLKAKDEPQELSATTKASHGIDIKQLGEVALETKDDMTGFLAKQRIRAALARLDANNLTGLIEVILHGGMMRTQREALLEVLLAELRSRDPGQFLTWSMKVLANLLPDGTVGLQSGNFAFDFRENAAAAFREWVALNPDAAEEWAATNAENWLAFTEGQGFGTSSLNTLMVGGLLTSDPKRAYAKLEALPMWRCLSVLQESGRSLTEAQIAALAEWAAALPDIEKRRHLVRKTILLTPLKKPKDGSILDPQFAVMRRLRLNEDDAAWIAARLVVDSVFTIENDISKIPKAEIAWVEKNVAPSRQSYVKGAIGHLFEPNQALLFLGNQLNESLNDDLIAGYVESQDLKVHRGTLNLRGGRHGDTAFRLAVRTSDPTRRIELLVKAWTDLHNDSSKAAMEILEIPELMTEDRALLGERIAPLMRKKP